MEVISGITSIFYIVSSKSVYEHAAFYLTVQHPGQWLKDFRADKSKGDRGDRLPFLSSSFQSVCIIVQLWMPQNTVWVTRTSS